MALAIPEEKIAEIRERVDIVGIVSQYVKLRRTGRNYVGLCPFHPEKTPSFTVSPDKQFFHCFGCNESGSVFKFLMKLDGKTFPEAVRELAQKAGVAIPTEEETPERARRREQRERLFDVVERAARFYQDLLLREEGRAGLRYLEGRAINREAISAFRLGFGGLGWDCLASFCRSAGISLRDAEQAGLVLQGQGGTYYDRFRQRVIFPISDASGKVRGFGGRLIEAEAEGAKYVNSPESAIYEKGELLYGINAAKEAVRREGCAIVVEGYLDCISLHQAGVRNVVAPCGTALTASQVVLLSRYCPEFVAAFDGDEAGEKARQRLLETVGRTAVRAKVAVLTQGFDPDSLVRSKGASAFMELVGRAVPVIEYAIETALGGRLPGSVDERMRALERLREVFEKIPAGLEREMYIRNLAGQFGMEAERLAEFFASRRDLPAGPPRRADQPSLPSLEERLLALMLEHNDLIEVFVQEEGLKFAAAKHLGEVFAKVVQTRQVGRQVRADEMLDRIEEEGLRDRLSRLMLESTMDQEAAATAFSDYMRKLERAHLAETEKRLRGEVERLAREGKMPSEDLRMELTDVQRRRQR